MTAGGTGPVGSDMSVPTPSPQLSPRPESAEEVPPAGGDGGEIPSIDTQGGEGTTHAEPLQEGPTLPVDRVIESPPRVSTEESDLDPATNIAGETEASTRQTSPGNSFALPPFFYHLAPCFWLSETYVSFIIASCLHLQFFRSKSLNY